MPLLGQEWPKIVQWPDSIQEQVIQEQPYVQQYDDYDNSGWVMPKQLDVVELQEIPEPDP